MSYIKKPGELGSIREGGRRMGEILEKLIAMVKPGVSAAELDSEAERLIRSAGGAPAFKGYRTRQSDSPFPGAICFSLNEDLVHGVPTKDKVIRNGDIVSIDIGMRWPAGIQKPESRIRNSGGYFTDTAMTVAVGKIPEKTQKLVDVTREALEAGIRAARPGETVAVIGQTIESFVRSRGEYGIVRDLVGHGVGNAVHEEPRVPNYYDKALESWVLEPGVVIAIEPMITLGGWQVETDSDGWTVKTRDRSLSAHFEHTVIVTSDGPEVVTRRPGEGIGADHASFSSNSV